ncbi:MAG: nitronate monooxygenase [Polyangiaceae bacterium]
MRTFLTEDWGLRVPIIGAPMSPQAGGLLAGALSNCGALGMLGIVQSADPVSSLRADVAAFHELAGDRPFGIGLIAWVLQARPELLAAALEHRPFAVSISFGDAASYGERIRAAGAKLICQVQDLESALAAEAAGADLIVAQGTEAGGHTGGVGTLPLLQLVLDAITVPVVAAGGIATGRGLAAVLAAGAQGAWIGTPFLAAVEARNSERARRQLLSAGATETVLTSAFDVAQGIPWPAQYRGRALQNSFTDRWHGHEQELAGNQAARASLESAVAAQDYGTAHLYAGQTVGLVQRVEPAAEIVRRIEAEAEARLNALPDLLARGILAQ